MVNRRLVGGANAVVIAVAVVIIAVLINALMSQVFWRFDLTSNQIYTLSEVSEEAAESLAEPVEVRAFISPNMPPPYHQLHRQVEELLMEYEAASGGMINFEIISPEDGEDVEELARGYGIEQVTIGQETDRERSYRAVYKGVAFLQGDRVETIGDLRSSGRPEMDNFEYEFTRALLNLGQEEPRKVAVLTGAGGPADAPQFVELVGFLFGEMYGQMLQVEAVHVDELERLVDEFSALVILNISGDLGPAAQEGLSAFLESGGNVGWFQSGGVVDIEGTRRIYEQMQQTGVQGRLPSPLRKGLKSDLVDFFGDMGIRFGADAVIDRERAMAYGSVPTDQGNMPVSHPAIFPIDDLAHDLPFMRYFSTLVLPLPATVRIEEQSLPDGAEVYEVMRSADSSVRLPEPPGIARYEELRRPMVGEQLGSYPLAVAMEADFSGQSGGDRSRVLVVGSGDLLDGYPEVGYHGELAALGIELFVSSVEWLAQEHELAGIRGKQMPALVAEVPRQARQSLQIINIVVVPGFFASIGLLMLVRRRRRKRELGELTGGEL